VAVRLDVPLPERFRGLPPKAVRDYTADDFRNWADIAKVVPDAEAESGVTARLEIPEADLETYRLPMSWGTYDTVAQRGVVSAQIAPSEVPGPGYHWYRLPACKVGSADYVWFFWSWIIQCDLAAGEPGEYEVHARIKFEGPAFPHGRADQKSAICVERVVTVKRR